MCQANEDSIGDISEDTKAILTKLEHLRNILVSVSTGGPGIQHVNGEYKESYHQLADDLNARGIQNSVPYVDLWDWHGKWTSGDLPTYRSRREYIRGLFLPIEKELREGLSARVPKLLPDPTGWPLVDRKLGEVRKQLESSSTEEQFQAVGLFCRETLIGLSQTVFNPILHPPLDNDKAEVSNTDAKRMLERYLAVEMSGKSNEISRRHAKAALDLANELQHRQTATFRTAALCTQATASVVNIVAILSGVRDPNGNAIVPLEIPNSSGGDDGKAL